ncbi:MAG TPA: ATP-binding cassette domain-containing protein [Alphaproteobacteria bacterium]|nr:ATP-binding cassette domain-containing protein [Alphaproteobacteria bacterium]
MVALLETRNLVKRFGGFVATNNVSITIERGEIRGLIGPNGAGKTTLANLITGVQMPSAGEIRLEGQSLASLEPHEIARKGLLRTFQVCRLFGNLTLLDNLLLPYLACADKAGRHGNAEGLERAQAFLALTKLTRLADAPAKSLSGGQRALLQVCCGFMIPGLKCYVLDEPFAGINPVIKDSIIDLILHENRTRGITFLIVSHEMSVMRRLCQKITVMIEGRVVAEGPLEEVAARDDVITAYLGKAMA